MISTITGGSGRNTRIHARVTSVSWIPSEAVTGPTGKATFATVGHYDDPPPDNIAGSTTHQQFATLDQWRREDRFRFANQLGAWIEVDDGRVVDAGYDGTCAIGATTLGVGGKGVTFQAVDLPVLRAEPEIGDGFVRFVQSYGGRTGVPMPRRVNRPPFVQFWAGLVWSTLALTLRSDGSSEYEVVGCSPFPRHWIYDSNGALAAKSGTADYKHWYRKVLKRSTPWGDADSPALVTAVESAAERELSARIMRGTRSPVVRNVKSGVTLMRQGEEGSDVFLLLDGVVTVAVDGEVVAELGPGAVLGERAVIEHGRRTSTVVASTKCRLAVARGDGLDDDALRRVGAHHRREQPIAERG